MKTQRIRDTEPKYYAPFNARYKKVRLFRVLPDGRGGWAAFLRDTAHSCIAVASLQPDKRWTISWRNRNYHLAYYSHEKTRRAAIIQCGAAAYRACELGWTGVLLAELDAILSRKTLAERGPKPDVIPIGAGTSLVSVNTLASAFRTSTERIRPFLERLSCPILPAPNGLEYVNLWTLELCLTIASTNTDLITAADLLSRAQIVYKAARKSMALDRLKQLGDLLAPAS